MPWYKEKKIWFKKKKKQLPTSQPCFHQYKLVDIYEDADDPLATYRVMCKECKNIRNLAPYEFEKMYNAKLIDPINDEENNFSAKIIFDDIEFRIKEKLGLTDGWYYFHCSPDVYREILDLARKDFVYHIGDDENDREDEDRSMFYTFEIVNYTTDGIYAKVK